MKPQVKNHPFLENPAMELKGMLIERKDKNPNYSARAFARDTGVSAAYLSQIINGRRNLSLKQTLTIASRLGIDLSDSSKTNKTQTSRYYLLLSNSIEHEKIIRYWYHFAILELCQVPGASSKPDWIADRLGISELEARTAVERLVEFGYVERGENHSIKRTQTPFIFSHKNTSQVLRSHHQNRLYAAIDELEQSSPRSVEHRDMQTIFVATTREQINSAKTMITEFTDKLMKHLASGPQEEVFQFSSQLFSTENKPKTKNKRK